MPFRATIDNTGETIEVADGATLLEAALAASVGYPHGCRKGRCGSCKSQLLEGEVTLLPHTRFALSEEEKAAGLILACRAQLQGDIKVKWLGRPKQRAAAAEVGGESA